MIKTIIFAAATAMLTGCATVSLGYKETMADEKELKKLIERTDKEAFAKFGNTSRAKNTADSMEDANYLDSAEKPPVIYNGMAYMFVTVRGKLNKELRKIEVSRIGEPLVKWKVVEGYEKSKKWVDKGYTFTDFFSPYGNNSDKAYFTVTNKGKVGDLFVEFDLDSEAFKEDGFVKLSPYYSSMRYADNKIFYLDGKPDIEGEISRGRFGHALYSWDRLTGEAKRVFLPPAEARHMKLRGYMLDNGTEGVMLQYWLGSKKTYEQYFTHNGGFIRNYKLSNRPTAEGGSSLLFYPVSKKRAKNRFGSASNTVVGLDVNKVSDESYKPENGLFFESPNDNWKPVRVKRFGSKVAVMYDYGEGNAVVAFELNGKRIKEIFRSTRINPISIFTRDFNIGKLYIKRKSFEDYVKLWEVDSDDFSIKDISKNELESIDRELNYFEVDVDGVDVGYSVIASKEELYDTSVPVMVVVYGGFGNSNLPEMNGISYAWLKHGTKMVFTHVRGGGEKTGWHKAGRAENKINSMKDLNAIINDLYAKKIAEPKKTVLFGASNGGLVTLSTMGLFKPNVAAIGVSAPAVDVRLLFTEVKEVNDLYIKEFGDARIDEDAKKIREWNPIDVINQNEEYPPIYILYSLTDNTVIKEHPISAYFKINNGKNEVYLRNEGDSGHSTLNNSREAIELGSLIEFYLQKVE